MKYAAQYLLSAINILQRYDGNIPLAEWLKQHFKANSKSGSKDRKHIGHLCYVYFRTGHALGDTSVEEKIKAALFLCNSDRSEWGTLFDDEWLEMWTAPPEDKWQWLSVKIPGTNAGNLFPWSNELSEGIDARTFADAHLVQPDLFLRIRPGKKKIVTDKLDAQQVSYHVIDDHCLALPNASRIDNVLDIDKEAVVQDLSSQRIAGVWQPASEHANGPQRVWDCCAASGGKSLLAYDLIKNIRLTVSDLRPSILHNLKKRFDRAGIKHYHSFIADLTTNFRNPHTSFHLILYDAPCSGSGTWGRTPEQLYFFTPDRIDKYSNIQKKISSNVIPYLAADGYLLYITCSVFKKENEEVVKHILREKQMELIHAELLKGYDRKADTMFAALFKKA